MNKNEKILCVSIVAIAFMVQPAFGDEIIITAENSENSILIAFDGDLSYILYETPQGISEHFDSKVKNYHTGAFSLKNPESGISLWAHPSSDTQYKIFILTNDGVQRMIGNVVSLNNIETTTTQEPKISLGADITKWDIPNVGRSDHKYEKPIEEWNPDTLDMLLSVPHKVQHKHNLNFDLIAIDTKIKSTQDQRLPDVSTKVTITNPIGEIVANWNGTTDNFGLFGGSYYIIDNMMLGEYKLKSSMEKENYTSISKIVSFFVMPIDEDSSSRKCPNGYVLNATGFCKAN